MKKLMVLLAVILLLAACTTTIDSESLGLVKVNKTDERFVSETFFKGMNSQIHMVEDVETGCKYLIASEFQGGFGTAMTPMLKSDGTPNCN